MIPKCPLGFAFECSQVSNLGHSLTASWEKPAIEFSRNDSFHSRFLPTGRGFLSNNSKQKLK